MKIWYTVFALFLGICTVKRFAYLIIHQVLVPRKYSALAVTTKLLRFNSFLDDITQSENYRKVKRIRVYSCLVRHRIICGSRSSHGIHNNHGDNTYRLQERAYQELWEIYGDKVSSNLPIKSEDLKHMEYLQRIIKETLRLFLAAPFIGRNVSEDLNIGEYTLPKGSSVFLAIMQIHRNEKYWPEPLTFDPDRFLPNEIEKRHPYCYIPFSGGPRNCIGTRHGMMSMKVLTATVLRRYVLKIDKTLNIEDIELKMEGFLKPANPVMIKIEERIADTNLK